MGPQHGPCLTKTAMPNKHNQSAPQFHTTDVAASTARDLHSHWFQLTRPVGSLSVQKAEAMCMQCEVVLQSFKLNLLSGVCTQSQELQHLAP